MTPEPKAARPRGTARTVWIVVASVFAVVFVGWAAFGVADLMARSEERVTASYDATEVGAVDVRIGSGTVHVVGDEDSSVTLDARFHRGIQANTYSQQLVGDTLTIRSSCPALAQWGSCRAEVWVNASPDVEVRVHNSFGDIEVVSMTGEVDLRSSSGTLRVEDVAGRVKVHTSHGDIEGQRLSSATVDAETSSGHLTLSFAADPEFVRARSSHGDVTVVVPESDQAYRVDASSSHGDVVTGIAADPRSSRLIEAHTSSGHVTVEYPSST